MRESITARVMRDLEARYLVYASMYSATRREEVVAIEDVKISVYVHGT